MPIDALPDPLGHHPIRSGSIPLGADEPASMKDVEQQAPPGDGAEPSSTQVESREASGRPPEPASGARNDQPASLAQNGGNEPARVSPSSPDAQTGTEGTEAARVDARLADAAERQDEQRQPSEASMTSSHPEIERASSALVRGVTFEYPPQLVSLEWIIIEEDRRRWRRRDALEFEMLKKSLEEVGQICPVFCIEDPSDETGHMIMITGFRRYDALKELGSPTIVASILPSGSRLAELIPIDDNLCHARMSKAELLYAIKRRCAVMKRAAAEAEPQREKKKRGRQCNEIVQEMARAFNLRDCTIRDYLRIERKLPEGAEERLAWTSLDTFSQMMALAELPRELQTDLITRAAAGESVSATEMLDRLQPGLPGKATAGLPGAKPVSDQDAEATLPTHREPGEADAAAVAARVESPGRDVEPFPAKGVALVEESAERADLKQSGMSATVSLWDDFLGPDVGLSEAERREFLEGLYSRARWVWEQPRGLQAFALRMLQTEFRMAHWGMSVEMLAAQPLNPEKNPFRCDASVRDLIAAGFLPRPVDSMTAAQLRMRSSVGSLPAGGERAVGRSDVA